jgi:hypothetical protein
MKTVFRRKVTVEAAQQLVSGIFRQCAILVEKHPYSQHECCEWGKRGFLYHPDYDSGYNWFVPLGGAKYRLIGDAGSGSHTLEINTENGELVTTHDGARRSYPGNGFAMLPPLWWELNKIKDWKLVSYKTSEPNWAAVAGLLEGQIGDGPTCQIEADDIEAEKILTSMRRKCNAAGFPMPIEVYYDLYSKEFRVSGIPWKPEFTGVHYRRAAANGVRL